MAATDLSSTLQFPQVGDGSFLEREPGIHVEELQLALRNHAMPLEALRYDVTPTGLHYTLIHYDIPAVEPNSWRLKAGDSSLTLEELQAMDAESLVVTMECAGDGRGLTNPRSISQPWLYGAVGTSSWTGVRVRHVLNQVGLLPPPVGADGELVFTGLDEGFEGGIRQTYQRSLPFEIGLDCLLAWEMNGAPLEPQHGFPLRLVVPGWYGMAHVKWLQSIDMVDQPFDGYQNAVAYRYNQAREEVGEPVRTMRVRSLLIPPGIPDFLTRTRVLGPGVIEIFGRAWSGDGSVTRVEFSADGSVTWADAELAPMNESHAWQAWIYPWTADPGEHVLCCRAHDSAGNVQPVDQSWTARGMGNNGVHKVPVIVVAE